MGWGPKLEGKGESELSTSFHLSLLPDCRLLSCRHVFSAARTVILQTVSQKKPSLLKLHLSSKCLSNKRINKGDIYLITWSYDNSVFNFWDASTVFPIMPVPRDPGAVSASPAPGLQAFTTTLCCCPIYIFFASCESYQRIPELYSSEVTLQFWGIIHSQRWLNIFFNLNLLFPLRWNTLTVPIKMAWKPRLIPRTHIRENWFSKAGLWPPHTYQVFDHSTHK